MKRLLLVALGLAACHGSAPTQATTGGPPSPPKDAIVKTAENGPVKAVVSVWPPKPTLGDRIYLRLEVTSPPGVRVDAPFQDAGDQRLGRFRIAEYAQTDHRDGSGNSVIDQTYTLDALASGRYRVPPLRLEMVDSRATAGSAATGTQEILTDEVPLQIAPVDDKAVDAELKPAAGSLAEDVGGTSAVFVLGIVSIVMVLGSGSILLVRALRARRTIEQQRSAYDEAVTQLRVLADRGAPDTDAADAWFVELSAIVRRYLEQRYSLRAPELTTDEFLLVASSSGQLSAVHQQLLVQFLERCDRVKFAGYRPDAEESLATLAAARGFVEDTRIGAELPAAMASAGKAAA